MILPTKNIAPDQALIAVGAQVLMQLDQPATVSTVLDRLIAWRVEHKMPSSIPFWWFALTLDFLYTTGSIKLEAGELTRVSHAS
ncbi:ABC-three component system middle component 6 [Actinomadura pelletieri]|uniref:ABC-three component system middle component 6 n=1 Tax=Actinomadura pelletieri TaxID=111805 RepID=UPI000EAD92DB